MEANECSSSKFPYVNTSAMSCNIWTVLKAVVESRPEVGSSRNRRDGLIIISFPILTLFLSPPDTPRTKEPPIIVSWHLFAHNISFTTSAFKNRID